MPHRRQSGKGKAMPQTSRRKRVLLFLLLTATVLYFWNASWLASVPATPRLRFIAHRGVYQNFDRTGLTKETCTATRIEPPTHSFLENTIPSMSAAFAAGATVVELDVHPTTDGHFAVIHDWTLDCRTNGRGVTREHSLADLQTLDAGHGYTADGGKTFPFRGQGVGLIPSLADVIAAFPGKRFLINFKSREAREGDMLAAHPEWRASIFGVYGGSEPTARAQARIKGLKGYSKTSVKACLKEYVALGWSGYVPEPCRNALIPVPINMAGYLWGWPNRFLARMKADGTEVILLGPYTMGDPGTTGIDTPELLASIPPGFDGYVWTNRMERVGGWLKARAAQ